jgi:hypothetical protein
MLSAKRFVRSGKKGSSGALAGGGADLDNARRSGPGICDLSPGGRAHTARRWRPGPARAATSGVVTVGDRLRPVAGQLCAAAAAP